MATYDIPTGSGSPVIAFAKRMVFPGQELITSRYSAKQDVIARGPGHWEGYVTFQPITQDGVLALELFFARLQGFVHTARVFLPGRYAAKVPHSGSLTMSVASSAINTTTHRLDLTLDITGTPSISAGDHINIGDRLYRVLEGTTSASDTTISVLPLTRPADGASIRVINPYILARSAEVDREDLVTEGWRNRPVVFDWVEAI